MSSTAYPPTPSETPRPVQPSSTALDRVMAHGLTINWQMALTLTIFVLAVFTRFYMLGERAMSHDESLHVYYSYNLYADGNFEHTPLMHGPILNHMTALAYALFGDNDFSGRVYTSVFGVLMVMTPLLFRRWLGRWGTILAMTLLLISPLIMYYNRYIRHDTPSILSALLMAWAVFMYLNGPSEQRRKAHWLYILAGAMIWNLGSKETAFFYVAAFGLFIMLYWFARMAQQAWKIPGRLWFYGGIMATLIAGTAALGMYIVLDITPLEQVASATTLSAEGVEQAINPALSWYPDLLAGGGLLDRLLWMAAIFVMVSLLVAGVSAVMYGLFRASLAVGRAAQMPHAGTLSFFVGLSAFVLMAYVVLETALGLFTHQPTRSLITWSMLVALFMGVVILGTLYWAMRDRLTQVPWRRVLLIVVAAAVVLAGLIVVEELSHVSRDAFGITAEPSEPAVPGEGGGETGEAITSFSWAPILVAWALAVILIAGLWWSRRAKWWDWLDRFPELDVLMIMGSLILPWLTAIFIVAARGSPTEYAQIAESLPGFLADLMPVNSPTQLGQFIVGFLAWLPMMLIAVIAGLTWNWKRYVVASLIFHAIFAFFFTTVFTNINGLASGMVYSLQYWLEQQAERRGDQPQYYYLLIIMPMYEYLPIVGSVLAMLAGLVTFWRRWLPAAEANKRSDVTDAAEVVEIADAAIEEETAPDAVESVSDAAAVEEAPRRSDTLIAEGMDAAEQHRYLTHLPFLLFFAFWAIVMLVALTLAGEKMPWLGTHLSTPMIFLTAWYFGRIFDRIDLRAFIERDWLMLALIPLGAVAAFRVIAMPLGGETPFAGVDAGQLRSTYEWLGALGVTLGVVYAVWRVVQAGSTVARLGRMLALASFIVLGVLTFRAAWMASFINYDDATEFLVYAHATPGTKIVMNRLEELSRLTTDGMDIEFAYDSKVSWPGVWYFREYPNARFMGDTPTLQQIGDAPVVIVGEGNRSNVEPLLEGRYEAFPYKRMWWPMMDYFNLNAQRVVNAFDLSPENTQAAGIRRGLFDIWWNRDYSRYGQAVGKDFSTTNWPVAEDMYMFVRRDFAAQVWDLGVGDGGVGAGIQVEEVSACVSNWNQSYAPLLSFDTSEAGLALPLGLDAADGRVYVAEDAGHRITVFDSNGQFIERFGQQGTALQEGAFFERPNSVAVADKGSDAQTLYVVDTWNYRIRRFDMAYQPLTAWGAPLTAGISAPTQPTDGFWGPRDIAIDPDGNVYVADTGNKRVRVYDADGNWLRDIGSGGSLEGQLDEPAGLAVHPDGLLYVADTWNRRVSIFNTSDGSFQSTIPLNAWFDELGNRPYLALDPARAYLYVTDPDAGRVMVYDTQTQDCLGAFGQLQRENPGPTQFATIGGVAVDAEGMVYVADLATGRVLKFPPFPRPEPAPESDMESDTEGEAEGPPGGRSIGVEVTAEVGE